MFVQIAKVVITVVAADIIIKAGKAAFAKGKQLHDARKTA